MAILSEQWHWGKVVLLFCSLKPFPHNVFPVVTAAHPHQLVCSETACIKSSLAVNHSVQVALYYATISYIFLPFLNRFRDWPGFIYIITMLVTYISNSVPVSQKGTIGSRMFQEGQKNGQKYSWKNRDFNLKHRMSTPTFILVSLQHRQRLPYILHLLPLWERFSSRACVLELVI